MTLLERLRYQIETAKNDRAGIQAVCASPRTLRDALAEDPDIMLHYIAQPVVMGPKTIYGYSVRVMNDLPDGVWVLAATTDLVPVYLDHRDYAAIMAQLRTGMVSISEVRAKAQFDAIMKGLDK